jgi:hypothetical protein
VRVGRPVGLGSGVGRAVRNARWLGFGCPVRLVRPERLDGGRAIGDPVHPGAGQHAVELARSSVELGRAVVRPGFGQPVLIAVRRATRRGCSASSEA